MANSECTFTAIKPDGVQRVVGGGIIKHNEQKGFCLVGLKFMQSPEDLLKEHYINLNNHHFLYWLHEIHALRTSGCYGLGGDECCEVRQVMLGETNLADSEPGTI